MTDSKLPNPLKMAPLRADPISKMGENWPIAWNTGNSGDDGQDWCIQTDLVRASEMIDLEFPADAKSDAEAIVAIVNAYREGRLVERTIKE